MTLIIGIAIGLAVGIVCPGVLTWIVAKYKEYKAKV